MTAQFHLTNKFLIKFIFTLIYLVSMTVVFSQIVTEETQNKPKTKNGKKINLKDTIIKTDFQEIVLSYSYKWTNRSLKMNIAPYGKQIGRRIDETGGTANDLEIAFHSYFNKSIGVSFGGRSTNFRYKYNFDSGDSTYSYTTNLGYFGLPLGVDFKIGKQIQWISNLGFMPILIAKRIQKTSFSGIIDKTKQEITTKNIDKLTQFGFVFKMASGFRIQLNNRFAFSTLLEYQAQLSNTYIKQGPFIEKQRAIGLTFGLGFRF